MDGEGLGHTPDTASSLSTTITSRFERADAIVLVDNAKQPMLAAPSAVLKALVTSGHIAKLLICFTHLDALDEHSLPDLNDRYEHVRNSLENVITNIGKERGAADGVKLRHIAEKRVYFVSKIQKKLPLRAAATRAQLNTLVNEIEFLRHTNEALELQPVYNNTSLFSFLPEAVQSFREAWKVRLGLSSQSKRPPEHWTRIKALARRPAQLGLDEYDTLRPVADLIRETSEQIKKFLDAPTWEATHHQSEEDRQAAIDRIARELYSQLHILAHQQLIRDHRMSWETAYFRYGRGSARIRAYDIDAIYRDTAPLPDE